MITISLCMIVKDEAHLLDRCLKTVNELVDEIVIVSTNNNEEIKSIASKYTDKVYDFEWVDDFSKARNFSFSKATKDYIMWMDADDFMLDGDQTKLKELKKNLREEDADIVMMKYNVGFDVDDNPTLSFYRERLLKRSKNYRWSDPVHEVIVPFGLIIYSDVAICHKRDKVTDPKRNLRIYESLISKSVKFTPRQMFYYARELYYNGLYEESIKIFEEFLDEPEGWVEDQINACQDLANCYYCLNKQNKALKSLFKSFTYASPRAEICCDVGKHFMQQEDYRTAAFWYEIARSQDISEKRGGFYINDCYGYIPNIQLCVCYYRLGEIDRSIQCNEEAYIYKPKDKAVQYNRKFFENINYRI